MDGQTDMTEVIVAFLNFVNAPTRSILAFTALNQRPALVRLDRLDAVGSRAHGGFAYQ